MFHLFKRAAASIPNAAAGKLRFFIDTDDRPKLKDENGNLIDLKTQDNFSGDYNDLINKPSITGTLLTGLTTATASAITATDSIISAFAKLQASIDTKADAVNTLLALGLKQDKLPITGTAGQFLAHDLTFKTPSSGGSSITWVSGTDACSLVTAGIDVSNLYFAKINGFLAVKGYYFGISGVGSQVAANSQLMVLKETYGCYCTGASASTRGIRNSVLGGITYETYIMQNTPTVSKICAVSITYKFGDPVYWSDACLGLLINP